VSVDFPADLLHGIDGGSHRVGVSRRAFITLGIAGTFVSVRGARYDPVRESHPPKEGAGRVRRPRRPPDETTGECRCRLCAFPVLPGIRRSKEADE
jgi:hypothetical protein